MAAHVHARRSGPTRSADTLPVEPVTPLLAAQHYPLPVAGVVRRSGGGADPLGGTAADPGVVEALRRRRGSGAPLPADVGEAFGSRYGADLSDVRVHADAEASRIARSVQATAFTHGTDVYFSAGTYAPGSSTGQRLLGHELAHVVQHKTGQDRSGGSGVEVGRADDPLERQADAMAGAALGALRRTTTTAAAPEPTSAAAPALHRWPWSTKQVAAGGATGARPKAGAEPVTANLLREPSEPTSKEAFEGALVGIGDGVKGGTGGTRLAALRELLKDLTPEQRKTIWQDAALMAKAKAFVGPHDYMSLVGALGMAAPATKKGAAVHLSGAEADNVIGERMGAIAHLAPFLTAAVDAGKKADGYIAIVGQQDWTGIYETQNAGEVAAVDGRNTNAFVANTHADRPAIINANRGTRSTAIHESMHRYSVLSVLRTLGSGLNEGLTEYFTRKITMADGSAVTGPSDRSNYEANHSFVRDHLLALLGSDPVTAETRLAKVYFEGEVGLIESSFRALHTAGGTSDADTATAWTGFRAALKGANWADAGTALAAARALAPTTAGSVTAVSTAVVPSQPTGDVPLVGAAT